MLCRSSKVFTGVDTATIFLLRQAIVCKPFLIEILVFFFFKEQFLNQISSIVYFCEIVKEKGYDHGVYPDDTSNISNCVYPIINCDINRNLLAIESPIKLRKLLSIEGRSISLDQFNSCSFEWRTFNVANTTWKRIFSDKKVGRLGWGQIHLQVKIVIYGYFLQIIVVCYIKVTVNVHYLHLTVLSIESIYLILCCTLLIFLCDAWV